MKKESVCVHTRVRVFLEREGKRERREGSPQQAPLSRSTESLGNTPKGKPKKAPTSLRVTSLEYKLVMFSLNDNLK